jgi:hypothetical protein
MRLNWSCVTAHPLINSSLGSAGHPKSLWEGGRPLGETQGPLKIGLWQMVRVIPWEIDRFASGSAGLQHGLVLA